MIFKTSVKLSVKPNDSRTVTVHQDLRNTAPYACGVALCQPLTRPASAPLARPALLKLARLAGTGKTNLLCGVRLPAASRSAIAPRTARYTASYPREAAGVGTTRRRTACRMKEGATNLLCGGRPAAASRLRRTTRYTASYYSRSTWRPHQRRPSAPLARPCIFSFLSRENTIKRIFPGTPL